MVAVGGLLTSRADWGNRQGNSATCFPYFPNEINSLGRRFVFHQPPHPVNARLPTSDAVSCASRAVRGELAE